MTLCGGFSDYDSCVIGGDPHYYTIDGCSLTYQGTCRHLVMESTNAAAVQFEIYVQNDRKLTPFPVATLGYIEVIYRNEITVHIWKNTAVYPSTVNVWIAYGPATDLTQVTNVHVYGTRLFFTGQNVTYA